VFTAFEAALVVATLAGALAVGPLLRLASPRIATLCFACAGFILLLLSVPILRSLEGVLGLRVFLRGVPLLAGLSRPLLDELAPRFETGAAATGDAIVREGEPGDTLYIIRRGEVKVSIAGRVVRRLGPAGYFGEVALLRSVPRTASVHACAPTEFYTLDRDTFQRLMQQAHGLGPPLTHRVDSLYVYSVPSSLPRH
jgi:CRP-like cAMP-binding protein